MFYIILAALAGVTIVVSRILNANLAKELGELQSTFYNFLTGLIFSILILLFCYETFNASEFRAIPFYAYIGGFIGIVSITLSNKIAPKISTFYMTLLVFIGQLLIGIIIDNFIFNEFSLGKILGGILVVIGLSYNLILDKHSPVDK